MVILQADLRFLFLLFEAMNNIQGSIDALKRLLKLMNSTQFREEYDEFNQDFVESFFSTQRQMCGAYVYTYDIHGYSCFQTAKALGKKQTNAYELEETLPYFDGECELPRRKNENSIYDLVQWYIEVYGIRLSPGNFNRIHVIIKLYGITYQTS